MFSSIINLKFPSTAEAKIAASHFSEILGSKISHYDYLGIQITIGKSGELSVCVRFDEATRLKKFENDVAGLLSDIKKSFIYKEEKYSGVCIYSFEREAQNSSVNISTGKIVN